MFKNGKSCTVSVTKCKTPKNEGHARRNLFIDRCNYSITKDTEKTLGVKKKK